MHDACWVWAHRPEGVRAGRCEGNPAVALAGKGLEPDNYGQLTKGIMKTHCSTVVRFAYILAFAALTAVPPCPAQTPPELDIQLYAGLTITGAVGTVYSVEYVTDLPQPKTPSAWRCLEYPCRFYRVVVP